jgi:cell division protease FtsH
MIISLEERRNTAYHESGHALVAKLTPGADPVHKVTIIPRGMALGLTMQVPADERHSWSKEFCINRLEMMFGGRAAEELVLGHTTTGARDDIDKATELARRMVCDYGMSEKIGPIALGKKEEQIFLGRDFTQMQDYSERTAVEIDEEVRRIIKEAYERAKSLLSENIDLLHTMAEQLLEKEVLDGAAIDELIRTHREQQQQRAAQKLSAAGDQRA